MKTAHPVALACALIVTLPSLSPGLGIRIADQDARATARGNAFSATADNPSAIYYNPAGISFLYAPGTVPVPVPGGKGSVPMQDSTAEGGLITRLGLYSITLGSTANLGPLGVHDIDHRWQSTGNFYATWKNPGSKFTFGLGMYTPYGFGIWYDETWPLRQIAISGNISYATLNPVVSWQISDTLSLAAGPTINYARTSLKQGIIAPGDGFTFEGEGWAVGLNAGLMWRPHPKHSFGVTYRSQTAVNFEGNSVTSIPGFISLREQASAGIQFPQHIIFGYSFRPTPKWNLEFNLDWTDWDTLNTVNLLKPTGPVGLPFNWQSSFFYEFGASYTFDCGLVASAGYIYSENSVPNGSFNPLLPDSNRHIFSVGLGKKWKNWDFDVAYQFAHGPERTVLQGSPADGTYQFDSHAISISAGYRF